MSLNGSKVQWIDLGVHFEVCMVDPETCGAAGGAVSMWLKLSRAYGGIMSTLTRQTPRYKKGGFGIFYAGRKIL